VALLEREPFLDALAQYAAEAAAGAGRLVLLGGEAGAGKTALLEAFEAQTVETRWLWSACEGMSTPQPLGPLLDIAEAQGGQLLEAASRSDRRTLFGTFLRTVGSPAPAPSTVVVIEDLHWADEATLDLLRFVSRRMAASRLVLVATFRDEGTAGAGDLQRLIGELATQRVTRRMSLPRLTASGVRELARGSAVDAAALYDLTAGNPFYVAEVLAEPEGRVPPTVQDAVMARVARLPELGRGALEAAAVIGRHIEPWLLEAVATETIAADAAAGIDACLASGTLVANAHTWSFRHELTRRAVEESISPRRRTLLHAAVLSRLEGAQPEVSPARLAYHAEMAGDGAATLRHARAAAATAAELRSHHEAADQLRRAIRFAGALELVERGSLYDELAEELAAIDHWEESAEARREALAVWREVGDGLRLGDGLGRYAVTLWRLCDGMGADAAMAESLAVLQALPPGPQLARAYARIGAQHGDASRLQEGLEYSQRALDLGGELDRPEIVAYALNTMGCILTRQGRDGLTSLGQALQIARDACDDSDIAFAYANLYQSAVDMLELQRYEWSYVEALRFCEEHDQRTFSLCLRGSRGTALQQLGRWDEVRSMSRAALAEVASPINRLHLAIPLAAVEARRGSSGASTLIDEIWRLAKGNDETDWLILVSIVRLEAAWLEGSVDDVAADCLAVFDRGCNGANLWYLGALAVWLERAGLSIYIPADVPEPYASVLRGDHLGAAARWREIGCPYEESLALADSEDPEAMHRALELLDELRAGPAVAIVRRRLRETAGHAPRGARPTTRTNPFRLTARELEILALVGAGLANAEIASRLVISERTVEHHVTAVLAKTGARTRTGAALEATKLGLAPVG
jgi:DNA-binding CsgD family transcriptional regulator/tetratricopeptide (TPR) repeat protein